MITTILLFLGLYFSVVILVLWWVEHRRGRERPQDRRLDNDWNWPPR